MPLANQPPTGLPPTSLPPIAQPQGAAPAMPTDPLAGLKDIHLPDPVSWWPLAPGWWLLLALLVAGIITVGLWLRQRHLRNAYKREAVSALDALAQQTCNSLWLQDLNTLLKRCAQSAYPQAQTAALHGKAWQDFLAAHSKAQACEQVMGLLADGGYQSPERIEAALGQHQQALLDFARQWVQQHPRQYQTPGQAVEATC